MSDWVDHGQSGAAPYADDRRAYDGGGAYSGGRKRRRWGRTILIVLLVLLLLLIGAYFYLDSRLNRIDVFTDYPGRPGDTPGTNWLIVGSDSRSGLSSEERKKLHTGRAEGKRTDSMMLLHIGDHGTTLVSLPRDSYVPIPGHDPNKLNAAYAFGGPKLLVRTVEGATKIHIDHYAEIGFGGFVGMVDAVGGVNMCIPQRIKDTAAGIDLKPGCQTLNGPEALGFVRTRHAFASQDLQRVQNQRKFLAALTHKATSPGTLLNPFRIVPFVLRSTSDFSVDKDDHLYNVAGFAWAMRGLTKGDGLTTTVPIGGNGYSASAGAYITWDTTRSGELFRALREDQPVPKSLRSSN
ncbi:LCP family protein [Actinoallomurus iriomotensis]|uniref:LytTR family transcriptional regulator n=1 Tax=Actinoallomurus iriomotensis TaxID=478107 RepID=A0A9W6S5B9_9ACTN|nr:LCP family protein [Actinoallomurus iriomotensis]GLY87359.1 LytTR family transcriptional regulator [Actinoallomurus iriomotensis]